MGQIRHNFLLLALGRGRTFGLLFRKHTLYPLSYKCNICTKNELVMLKFSCFYLELISFHFISRRYVTIPINRISIGDEKLKVVTVCDAVQRLSSSHLIAIVLASLYSLRNPQGRIHLYCASFQRVNSRTYQIVNCNHYLINPKCILRQYQDVWINSPIIRH